MASLKVTQLSSIPWPALAGASLLLHVGVLIVGLPRMLQVGNPVANNPSDIPITLVDDGDIPAVAASTNTPATSARDPSVPTLPDSLAKPIPATAPIVTPIGGQNTSAKPVEQGAVQSPESSPTPPQKPALSTTENTNQPTPNPETVNEPPRETVPAQPPATIEPLLEEGGRTDAMAEPGDNSETSSPGPTQVSIVNTIQLPKDSGGDQIDQYPSPRFEMPITFDIPSNHACQGTLSADVINLGVMVNADGLTSSFRLLQSDIYAQNLDLNLADCLLTAAVTNPSAIRFTPALRLTNIGEEEAVPTDRIQLRLQFSER